MDDDARDDGDRRHRKGRARKRERRERKRRKSRRPRATLAGPGLHVSVEDGKASLDQPGYREAVELADQKLEFGRDLLKFGFWVTLALIFVFPVGVIILICGGPKRFRGFSELYLEPRARRRLRRAELRKRAGRRPSPAPQSPEPAEPLAAPTPAADPAPAEHVAYDRVALEELDGVERSISQKLRGGGAGSLRLAEMCMVDVVDAALESLRDRLSQSGTALQRRIDGEGAMTGDAEKLRQVIVHVVGNAIEALAESDTPSPCVDLEMGENLAGSEVWIRVRDNGPEVDAESRKKAFDPFFTPRANGGSSGLAIAKQLVDAHGGLIGLASDPAGGVEVLITLPRQPGEDSRGG